VRCAFPAASENQRKQPDDDEQADQENDKGGLSEKFQHCKILSVR
jgi:hypothetical protein